MMNPVTTDMVDEALDTLGVRDVRRTDHTRAATFGPSVAAPSFRVIVTAEPDAPVLALHALPGVAFAAGDNAVLLAACNAWHETHRWPRLTVINDDGTLTIHGDLQIPCHAGLTVDQTTHIIGSFISATSDFWEHMTSTRPPIDGVLAGLAELLDRTDTAE